MLGFFPCSHAQVYAGAQQRLYASFVAHCPIAANSINSDGRQPKSGDGLQPKSDGETVVLGTTVKKLE